jgi:hypothetical protein
MLTSEEKVKVLANRAADLWIEQMDKGHWNNGDDSQRGGMAFLLGTRLMQNARAQITPANLTVFRNTLVEMIIDQKPYFLSTDYAPEGCLAVALQVARISGAAVPVKCSMQLVYGSPTIEPSIEYRFGYSGKYYKERFIDDQLSEPVML